MFNFYALKERFIHKKFNFKNLQAEEGLNLLIHLIIILIIYHIICLLEILQN